MFWSPCEVIQYTQREDKVASLTERWGRIDLRDQKFWQNLHFLSVFFPTGRNILEKRPEQKFKICQINGPSINKTSLFYFDATLGKRQSLYSIHSQIGTLFFKSFVHVDILLLRMKGTTGSPTSSFTF